ncbi:MULTISPECIES: hypothetical protein [unclassified Bradyrhizobium]|uniref:hypothetical protein n=1 Tax=Bradyrhizobium sp. USDA 4541 TaxID=2817704 RepID=UPI0020A2A31D|nr:hypothetical protein [Bradyrhizobium sp. USDA 4541]MCP1848378.1 hypothetical protein [Bradyrhizobium sp. USDA 4541]
MAGQVVLMKMAMGRHPAVDAVVPSSVLIEICKYYFAKDEAIAYVVGPGLQAASPDPTNAIYIADLEETPNYFSLLLVRGDPKRAIPAFVNPMSRVVIQSKPEDPGFVPGASCHIVISRQEIASGNDQGRFRMVMEQTKGIGRTLAKDFLTLLMQRFANENPHRFVAQKKRRSKRDKPESIAYRPTVRFHPQMNGNLKKDLEEGRIGGFKLTRGSTKFQGEADEPAVQRLDVQLQAKIAPTQDFSKVKRLVDHVRQTLNAISFEALNVELVDDSGHHIDNVSANTINIANLDDVDMRYCKTVGIPDAGVEEAECYSAFHLPTKQFAMKCLQTPDHWK